MNVTLRGVKFRWCVFGVILSCTAAVAQVACAGSARANDAACPHGNNSQATACFHGHVAYGSYVEFHNNKLAVNGAREADDGWHANQSIWAYSGSPCTKWVEEGVTQGYTTPAGVHEVLYGYYWAYRNATGYNQGLAGTTTPNGTNHSYLLQFETDDRTYNIDRDGGTVLRGIAGLGSGTCVSQAGLELTNPTGDSSILSSYSVDTFDLNPLKWQDSSYTYHTGWNTASYWNDFPCGQSTNPPFCMNGVFLFRLALV